MSAASHRSNGPASPTGKYIDGIDPDDPAYIKNLQRPAEVKEDLQQMENRSRVSLILNSQAFKEELEQVVEEQLRNGPYPASLIALQQITDLLLPHSKGSLGSLARSSAVIPINDLRGGDNVGFVKGEKLLRCKLAALYRLVDLCGWSHGIHNHISARVSTESEHFLLNPFGLTYSEITASSLAKVDIRGDIIEPGSSHLGIYKAGFSVHSAIHQARPDIKCVVHLHTPAAVAISALKCGLLAMSQEALICGNISYHDFQGIGVDADEREKLARSLGVHNKILILRNRGVLACGETVEEAFHFTFNVMAACEAQVKAMPVGLDNIVIPSAEAREQTFRVANQGGGGVDGTGRKWKTGELEFEALMRTLDNSGFRTGYVYKMPVVKQEKKERSNSEVEIPPSSSSFTYIFDGDYEHSKYASPVKAAMERHKKAYKAGWLTTPNAYKKTEVDEIGTITPKKITKWVTEEDSPNRPTGTPIKVDSPNQFAPQGDNPKEYREKQKSIKKDYYEERITAGPQSKILEGLTWDEAQRAKDGQLNTSGDQLIVVGAASKGIIQRDHQHNAVVYRQYYAANPFENMTEAEIDEYQAEVQRRERGEPVSVSFAEEEIPEPVVEVVKESPAPQRAPEPERRDTEARRSRPAEEAREVSDYGRYQPPQGHDTINEEAMLASLADRVVQTVIHDALSVARQGKGQQILLGAEPRHKHHFLNHGPVGSQIIPDGSEFENFFSGTLPLAVNCGRQFFNADKCSDFCHRNSVKTQIAKTYNKRYSRARMHHEGNAETASETCHCQAGASSSEGHSGSCCQKYQQLDHTHPEASTAICDVLAKEMGGVAGQLSRGGSIEEDFTIVPLPYCQYSETGNISMKHPEVVCSSLEHTEVGCSSLEHTEVGCSSLEHTEVSCSSLEHPEVGCSSLEHPEVGCSSLEHTEVGYSSLEHTEVGYSSLEHPEVGCSSLEHTEVGYSSLEHTEVGCSSLEHTEVGCSSLEHTEVGCSSLEHTEVGCSSLEHPEVGCSSLEHTEVGCSSLEHPEVGCSSLEHPEVGCSSSSIEYSIYAGSTSVTNDKSEETDTSTSEGQPTQLAAKSSDESMKTTTEHGRKLLLLNSTCPESRYQKIKRLVELGLALHAKNKENLTGVIQSSSPTKDDCLSQQVFSNICNLISYAEVITSNGPPVAIACPVTRDTSSVQTTRGGSVEPDTGRRQRFERRSHSAQSSRTTQSRKGTSQIMPGSESPSSRQKWVPKQKQENRKDEPTISGGSDRDETYEDVRSVERNYGRQTHKRVVEEAEDVLDTLKSQHVLYKEREEKKASRTEEARGSLDRRQRDRDLSSNRREERRDRRSNRNYDYEEGRRDRRSNRDYDYEEGRRDRRSNRDYDYEEGRRDRRSNRDYDYEEGRRDRHYVSSRRDQEYTDDDNINEPYSRKGRNDRSERSRRDNREDRETYNRQDVRRERGNERGRKYVESDGNQTETDSDESYDQSTDAPKKSEDRLIKELKGKIEDRKSRIVETSRDIEKEILFGNLIREADNQKPIRSTQVAKVNLEENDQKLMSEVEKEKVEVKGHARRTIKMLTAKVDDLSGREINSDTESVKEPVKVRELAEDKLKEVTKTDSFVMEDSIEAWENEGLGFENRRGDYRDRKSSRRYRGKSEDRHRRRQGNDDDRRNSDDERRMGKRDGTLDGTLDRIVDHNKENLGLDAQRTERRTPRSKLEGEEGQLVLAENKIYSVSDSNQRRHHRHEERETRSRTPIDRTELTATTSSPQTTPAPSDSTKTRENDIPAFDKSPKSSRVNIALSEDVGKLSREQERALAYTDGELMEAGSRLKSGLKVGRDGEYKKRRKKEEQSESKSEHIYEKGYKGNFTKEHVQSSRQNKTIESYSSPRAVSTRSKRTEGNSDFNEDSVVDQLLSHTESHSQVIDDDGSLTGPDIHIARTNKRNKVDTLEKQTKELVSEKRAESKADDGVFKQVVDSLFAPNISEQSNKSSQKELESDSRVILHVKERHRDKERRTHDISTKDKTRGETEHRIHRRSKAGRTAPKAVPEDDIIIGNEETVHRSARNVHKEAKGRLARERDDAGSSQDRTRFIVEGGLEDEKYHKHVSESAVDKTERGRARSDGHKGSRYRTSRDKDIQHFDDTFKIKNLKSEYSKTSRTELTETKETETTKYESHVLTSQLPKQNRRDVEDELSLKGSAAKTGEMADTVSEFMETHFDNVSESNTLEKVRDARHRKDKAETLKDVRAGQLETSSRDKHRQVERGEHSTVISSADISYSSNSDGLNKRSDTLKGRSSRASKTTPETQVEIIEQSYSVGTSGRKVNDLHRASDFFDEDEKDITEDKRIHEDHGRISSKGSTGIIVKARRVTDKWYPAKSDKNVSDEEISDDERILDRANKSTSKSRKTTKSREKTARGAGKYDSVREGVGLIGVDFSDDEKKRSDMDGRIVTPSIVSDAVHETTYQTRRSYSVKERESSVPEADLSDEDGRISAKNDRSFSPKKASGIVPKLAGDASGSYHVRKNERRVLETNLSDEDAKRPRERVNLSYEGEKSSSERTIGSKLASEVGTTIAGEASRSFGKRNERSLPGVDLSYDGEKSSSERTIGSKLVSEVGTTIAGEASRSFGKRNERSLPGVDLSYDGEKRSVERTIGSKIVSEVGTTIAGEASRSFGKRNERSLPGVDLSYDGEKSSGERTIGSKIVSEVGTTIAGEASRSFGKRNERSLPEVDLSYDGEKSSGERSFGSKIVSEVGTTIAGEASRSFGKRNERIVLETNLSDEDEKRPREKSFGSKIVSEVGTSIAGEASRSFGKRNERSLPGVDLSYDGEKRSGERSFGSKIVSEVGTSIAGEASRSFGKRNERSLPGVDLSYDGEKRSVERTIGSKIVSEVGTTIAGEASRSFGKRNERIVLETNLSDEDEKRPRERSFGSKIVSEVGTTIAGEASRSFGKRNERSLPGVDLSYDGEKSLGERSFGSKIVSEVGTTVAGEASRSFGKRNERSLPGVDLSYDGEKSSGERSFGSKIVSEVGTTVAGEASRSFGKRNERSLPGVDLSYDGEKSSGERTIGSKIVSEVGTTIAGEASRSFGKRNERSLPGVDLSYDGEKSLGERSFGSKIVSEVGTTVAGEASRSFGKRNERSLPGVDLSYEGEKRSGERTIGSKIVSEVGTTVAGEASRSFGKRNERSLPGVDLSYDGEKRSVERSFGSKIVSEVGTSIAGEASRSFGKRNERSLPGVDLSYDGEKSSGERTIGSKIVSEVGTTIAGEASRSFGKRNERSLPGVDLSYDGEKSSGERSFGSKIVSEVGTTIAGEASRSFGKRNERSLPGVDLSYDGEKSSGERTIGSKIVSEVGTTIAGEASRSFGKRNERSLPGVDLSYDGEKSLGERSFGSKIVSEVGTTVAGEASRSFGKRNERSLPGVDLSYEGEKRSGERTIGSKIVSEVGTTVAGEASRSFGKRNERSLPGVDLSYEGEKRSGERTIGSKIVSEVGTTIAGEASRSFGKRNERSLPGVDLSYDGEKRSGERTIGSKIVSEVGTTVAGEASRSFGKRNERSLPGVDLSYEGEKRSGERSFGSKIVSETVPKVASEVRRSYNVKKTERRKQETDMSDDDKKKSDKEGRTFAARMVSKITGDARKSYSVGKNNNSMQDVSDEDPTLDIKYKARTPKMASDISNKRTWRSVSEADVPNQDRRIIDERVEKRFYDGNGTSVRHSDSLMYEGYSYSEADVKVQERQKYAGFVKRTGRSGRKSHPMRGVSLEDDDSDERPRVKSENTKAMEAKSDLLLKTSHTEGKLDTSFNDDFSAVVHDNPIELTIDHNEDDEPPQSPRKGIFSLFSCVGGRSSQAARMSGRSKKKRPTAYYEEGEKRKIKKISKVKEKEEKKVLYFEKAEEASDSNHGGEESFGALHDAQLDVSDEDAPRLPEVKPRLQYLNRKDSRLKRPPPFQPPKLAFDESADTFDDDTFDDTFDDTGSKDDEISQKLSEEKKVPPEESSAPNLSDHEEEGKFSTFMSFGKANVSPGISRPGRFGYNKGQEPESSAYSAKDTWENVAENARERLHSETATAHSGQEVELRDDRLNGTTMDVTMRQKSSRISGTRDSGTTGTRESGTTSTRSSMRKEVTSAGRVSEARLSDFIAGIPPPTFGEAEVTASTEASFPPPPDSSSSSML